MIDPMNASAKEFLTMVDPVEDNLSHLPFTQGEYDRRWEAVLNRLNDYHVDAIISTFGRNHQYLTGHGALGAYGAPYYLIIAPDKPRTYVVREYDERTVQAETIPLQIHSYLQLVDAPKLCAEVIKSMGLDRGRIGLELDLFGMTAHDVMELQRMLPEVQVVDVSRLIMTVSDIKSDQEIATMRSAMQITDVAMTAFYDSLAEGVSEIECFNAFEDAIISRGAKPMTVVTFGTRTGLGHASSSDNRLKSQDMTYLEGAAHVHDYAAALVRSAICGRNPKAEALYELSNQVLEAAISAARPGATAHDVDRAARKIVEQSSFPEALNHRAGYSIGLQWVPRGSTSLEPGASDILQPNMTLHIPMILSAEDSQFAIGCSEMILVTEGNAEVMSDLSRELRFV